MTRELLPACTVMSAQETAEVVRKLVATGQVRLSRR
jgi:hypothetical protein